MGGSAGGHLSLMIGLGLTISTMGPPWPLWIGHGLFIGLIGLGGINAPLYIYVSRWFDRRRGSALALISSGTYIAGSIWPPIFEQVIANYGWRQLMLWYAIAEIAVTVPLAAIYFRTAPEMITPPAASSAGPGKARILGWPPNAVFAMMCAAGVLCCIPMAMPPRTIMAMPATTMAASGRLPTDGSGRFSRSFRTWWWASASRWWSRPRSS